VHEGADLGFLLDVERRTHSSGLALIVPRSPIVGARDADWVSEMKQAAHQAHTQGYRLVGVTLSETEAHSGLAYCGIPFDEVLHYRDLGLEGVLEQILSADLVISMRLHALLIGALGGALLQPVGTDPKLRRAIWDDEGPKRGAAPRLIESSVLSRKRAKAKESLASLFRQCST
jgi:polysaccharide pyruvyl transferase WcaK-like protein